MKRGQIGTPSRVIRRSALKHTQQEITRPKSWARREATARQALERNRRLIG